MRIVPVLLLTLIFLTGCTEVQWQQAGQSMLQQLGGADTGGPLTDREIDAGLREALRIGSERVVVQVGRHDGYFADSVIHIPLPAKLAKARDFARRFGLSARFDEVEEKLNRAAEAAAPEAKALFWQAIRDMRLSDMRTILNGPDDAATRYFETKMSPALARSMRPVVDRSLNEVGAIRSWNRALQEYNALPLAPRIDFDLSGYVIDKGMQGIFHYLANEEAAIRHNPLKRSTQILQRVFGSGH